jgi:hypothetical protein
MEVPLSTSFQLAWRAHVRLRVAGVIARVRKKSKIMRRDKACQASIMPNFLKLLFETERSKVLMQRLLVCHNRGAFELSRPVEITR